HGDHIESLPALYGIRAKVEFDQGDHSKAIEDLEHAVRLDPRMAERLFGTNVTPNEPKATSPPCEWNTTVLDGLVKEFPKDYRVYLFRGLHYGFYGFPAHAENYAAARADIQRAI